MGCGDAVVSNDTGPQRSDAGSDAFIGFDAAPGFDAGSDSGALDDDVGPGADGGGGGADSAPVGGACSGAVGSRDRVMNVMSDGRMRTFRVHLPASYDGRTPMAVVLNYHGRMSNSSDQTRVSGMNGFADEAGFIAIHPDGVGGTWNGGLCCGTAMSSGIDDVGFTSVLLDAVEAELCVDNRRVYATGLSNGGFMAYRLACDLSARITAIAPVAGTDYTTSCSPSRPVPVFHFHGSSDFIVRPDGVAGFGSVDGSISGWTARNGCSAGAATYYTNGDVSCQEWSGCNAGANVRLCMVDGGGHQWPGGFTIPGLGHNTSDISATRAMWEFFQLHSL